MSKFTWCIDSENYLSNSSKYADKMSVRRFIDKICGGLDEYSEKYTLEDVKAGRIKHCHACAELRKKDSGSAKRLYGHMQEINAKLGNKPIPAQISEQDIYQFKIKGVDGKQEYRCFGYFLPGGSMFNLIYLDPDHEIYKE